MSADATQALVQSISDSYTFNLVLVGSLFLILYDNIICFPAEFRLVWKSKWTPGKFLYIGCRYITPLCLLPFIPLRMKTDCSTSANRVWLYALDCLSIISILCPQILMCFRTYVLYRSKKTIKWFIILLYIVEATTLITMLCLIIKGVSFLELPIKGTPCIFSISAAPQGPNLAMLCAALVFESTLWFMSLSRLLPLVLSGQRSMVLLLFRDGMLYFTVVTLLCLPEVILYALLPKSRLTIATMVEPIMLAFSTMLSSRLILNLRAHNSGEADGETQYISMGDLQARAGSGRHS